MVTRIGAHGKGQYLRHGKHTRSSHSSPHAYHALSNMQWQGWHAHKFKRHCRTDALTVNVP